MEQPSTPIASPFAKLLHSRKFLVLVLDTVISTLLYYQLTDPALIAILQPVFLMLIGGIAYEDGQAMRAIGQANFTEAKPLNPDNRR
jgi:hypothetical protein